jgi:hypothetical protein
MAGLARGKQLPTDQVMCRMRKPVAAHDIYIVEKLPYSQGWVEGVLATAESTLQEFFGLKTPADGTEGLFAAPNPCPGSDDLEGCVKCNDGDEILDSITPNCLKAVEEG